MVFISFHLSSYITASLSTEFECEVSMIDEQSSITSFNPALDPGLWALFITRLLHVAYSFSVFFALALPTPPLTKSVDHFDVLSAASVSFYKFPDRE